MDFLKQQIEKEFGKPWKGLQQISWKLSVDLFMNYRFELWIILYLFIILCWSTRLIFLYKNEKIIN